MMQSMPRRHGGFSLVELMVSVVIGLLALLFATRLVVSGETNKDAAIGGSDSMQNGMLALFSLSGDAGIAGWGLNDRTVSGCDTTFFDQRGYQLLTVKRDGADVTPLAPVVIQSNGAEPDVISFNSGSSNAGVGSMLMTADYGGENFVVASEGSPYGYSPGDVLLVAAQAPDRPCTLMQVSGFMPPPLDTRMTLTTGGVYRYNQIAGMAQAYKKNVTYMYNLGQPDRLHFHTWSVRNGVLRLRATDLAGAEAAGTTVVDNVVSIKAQYGFDTRVVSDWNPNPSGNGIDASKVNPLGGIQVTRWSGDMINADGDAETGGLGDYQRIAAVRIAVVARSKTAEKPAADGTCSATTVLPTVFGGAAPASVPAVPVQVNVAVAGDTLNWKCYRYRVFETIVPFLNSQFRP
ncbi:PilW family protein [Duganella aceris]|uniref:Prepilin-type N-terminal cleavage/methylation domain-containing protein n=1 Tax=Duganella aceris TaxID=2703883 RepID=A0ABX0FKC4_9BURK|nr:PilW family protein [Duganella aceris]NGZ84968.1 prepilin-type N-terminal cleavage/methylation domain-containing protein [Duganella aceris]